jgi:preprotein translocase subunit SecB
VLVEVPRLLFPFARNIIAETTRDGGFPPLMINPIDFSELARRNAAAAEQAPATVPGASA